jgi:hypothetical protein
MIIPVKGLGEVGLVTDLPFNELPLNAWTAARNVRFRAGAVEKMLGHIEVFSGSLNPAEWLLFTMQGGTVFWLYAGTAKVGATDGASHADITRATGGNYNMSVSAGWTGGLIEDIPVINNGLDVPQMWNKPALNKKLEPLPNWPANLTANALRVFKRYIILLDVSKAGLRYPTMIKWSHQAPTGAVPQQWDETDETIDAGEYTLPGDGGFLVDAVPLRDHMVLYKESQTWLMQYIGGVEVFRFPRLFGTIGMLGRRCAQEWFSGKHIVFTGDDVVVHDGNNADSVLDERARAMLKDGLDKGFINRAFVALNYRESEAWVCVPEVGQTYCTKALVWNWKQNRWGSRELPKASFIERGLVSPQSTGETWDAAVGTWEDAVKAWGDRQVDPTQMRTLMAVPGESKLYVPETSQQFSGADMVASAERQGIGFPLKSGQPPDFTRMKQVLGLFPLMTGTDGGVVNVSLGTQDKIGKPPTWRQTRAFKIGETTMCDFAEVPASRLHAVKFESNSDISWKLAAYDADVVDRGAY